MDKVIWRRAINATPTIRPAISRTVYGNARQVTRQASSAPSVLQPSFWKGLIPKPFRRSPEPEVDWGVPKKPKSKEWNPATFYIVIFLFIGSMSIQMIALKKDFDTFMRRAEVRIGLLREVVEKLQRGEEVDVEKTLGTDDAEKESEWEEVLREIERENILQNANRAEKTKTITPTTSAPASTEGKSADIAAPPKTKSANFSNFF